MSASGADTRLVDVLKALRKKKNSCPLYGIFFLSCLWRCDKKKAATADHPSDKYFASKEFHFH